MPNIDRFLYNFEEFTIVTLQKAEKRLRKYSGDDVTLGRIPSVWGRLGDRRLGNSRVRLRLGLGSVGLGLGTSLELMSGLVGSG